MKKLLFVAAFAVAMIACSNGNSTSNTNFDDTLTVDTIDTTLVDSICD